MPFSCETPAVFKKASLDLQSAWRWVDNDWVFIFGWTIPLNYCCLVYSSDWKTGLTDKPSHRCCMLAVHSCVLQYLPSPLVLRMSGFLLVSCPYPLNMSENILLETKLFALSAPLYKNRMYNQVQIDRAEVGGRCRDERKSGITFFMFLQH